MTTVYYQAKWSSRFSEENTAPQTFHSPVGDVTVDFMHTSFDGHYYWGDQFGAAGLSLANGGGTMWFLLPDEGVSPEDCWPILRPWTSCSPAGNGDQKKYLIVNLALPKFDISSPNRPGRGLAGIGRHRRL